MRLEGVIIHRRRRVGRSRGRPGTRVWHEAQVREGAVIGSDCHRQGRLHRHQGASATVQAAERRLRIPRVQPEDGVFLGPGVMLLNDKNPRAINPTER
jgi:hypothetical protein